MADTRFRTVRWTRREFAVPCRGDYAPYVEVIKAIRAAQLELEGADVEVADDTIRVRPGNDEVIVYYEIEEVIEP
jgi:hypothetical protein